MSRIFLDTNIFIYFIEDTGLLGELAAALFARMSERRDEVITSVMTLGEVLTKPLREGREDIAEQYERALTSPGISIVPFGYEAARLYARIRIDRAIKAPDAIQLAVAASAGCDLFITNDNRLTKCVIPGIQFISGIQQALI